MSTSQILTSNGLNLSRPVRSRDELFNEFIEVGYALGVEVQNNTDADDDFLQLRLSDWLDETASLCALLDLRSEATL